MEQERRTWWAEFLGTFTLCFIGQGSICAVRMMGPDGGGLVTVAIAHGLALATMISALGAVSGAHFNPAVTLGFLVTGRMSARSAAFYWGFQLLGAVVASWLLTQLFPNAVWQSARLGATTLAPVLTPIGGLVLEAIMTLLLVTAVWGTAVDERRPPIGGFGIGLTLGMCVLAFGPLTGAALNPARAFGAALFANAWEAHWVYWIGPLVGGAVAALIYDRLILGRRAAATAARP